LDKVLILVTFGLVPLSILREHTLLLILCGLTGF
jgi:hypothetical protein